MAHHLLFMLIVTFSVNASVCWAKFTIVANDTSTSYGLGCKMTSGQQECVWKGPNSQILSSSTNTTNPNPRVWVELDPADLHCHLYFSPALLEDEGVWHCVLEGNVSSTSWELIVQVRPNPPVISYSNGTSLTQESMVINELPFTMPLKCFSGHAKPKQKSIGWLINGVPPSQSDAQFREESGKFFRATTFLNVTFSEDHQPGFVMKNVTCVVWHLAGETSARAFIKILYDNSSSVVQSNFWFVLSSTVATFVVLNKK